MLSRDIKVIWVENGLDCVSYQIIIRAIYIWKKSFFFGGGLLSTLINYYSFVFPFDLLL